MNLSQEMRGWLALAYQANVSGQGGGAAMRRFKDLVKGNPDRLAEAKTELARIKGLRILNLAQRDFATYQIMKALEAGIEEAGKNAP